MFRTLLYGLAILHLGPGLAFAALAFGCSEQLPVLGMLCVQDQFHAFALVTLATWATLVAVLVLYLKLKRGA